jgi:hypothetical protein
MRSSSIFPSSSNSFTKPILNTKPGRGPRKVSGFMYSMAEPNQVTLPPPKGAVTDCDPTPVAPPPKVKETYGLFFILAFFILIVG